MVSKKLRAVIFDFDYTLADSSRGAVECVNFALKELGLQTASPESICRTIGLPLPDTLLKLTGRQHAEKTGQFVKLFKKRADEMMADATYLFESVPQTLHYLKRERLKLGIVSTKFRYRIEAVLRRERSYDYFDVIVGGEDVAKHKPDPECIEKAIDKMCIGQLNTVYVGDSVVDAETAKQAGVAFVAVLSGVTKRDDLAGYEIHKIISNLRELPAAIGI